MFGCNSLPLDMKGKNFTPCQLRWVKAGFYCGQDYWPQKVYGVFCRQEVSCYCIVVHNASKQIGFHRKAPPSCKQRPLIKAALTLFQPIYAVPNIPYN